MRNINILIPIIIYILITIYIAYRVTKNESDKSNFTKSYYIGNRDMGGFVLAMTMVATYIGASSFIGGPGMAYKLGLGWVFLACIQIPLIFLTLGILGKKLAIISRKLNAITLIDILKARYNNKFLVILLSMLMLVFLIASIVAQFVGGARLFEGIINIDYKVSLTIFASIVILYTTIGGFKAVTITDAIQGLIMIISTIVLFVVLYIKGNGMSNIVMSIKNIDPNLITPQSGGNIAQPFILSFWILVGVGVLGLPATTVRCMGYKDTKSLHKAMLIGTFVVGLLLIGMHIVGFMGRGLEPNIDVSDKIIPILASKYLHPILIGVFIGGPLAAVMSTVDSLLILVSSTIVKDIYINYINPKVDNKKLKKISLIISLSIGLITYLLALNQSSLIVWINLFALSGQEVLFFAPIILGLYWEKGTAKGAIYSVLVGFILFIFLEVSKFKVFGLHNIVPSLAASVIIYILVSIISYKKTDEKVKDIFFK